MKEIYYDRYTFCDSLGTEMYCDGELVNMNNVEKVKVKFPNGDIDIPKYVCVDEYIGDRDICIRDMNFIFKFKYKGIILKETARNLLENGCKVYIETAK